ncbi:MAG: mechanosensitive ion channel family protein [Spartobacteria bacterium]|nr:mechanosensitive ion channel family protein [Spartobacteria bacterium]
MSDLIHQYLGWDALMQRKIFGTLLVLVAFFVVRYILHRFVRWKLDELKRRYFARKTVTYVLGFITLIALWQIWLGTGSGMAAYLGILSAGMAIALRDPLTNLAGWIFISIRKPFMAGDRIEINNVSGDIIDIELFQFTLLEVGKNIHAEQSTGRIVHIPNGWTFQYATINYTQGFNFVWNELAIIVTFESNWKKAKALIEEIGQKHTAIRSEHAAEQVRKAARKYLIFFHHLTPIVWTSVEDIGVQLTLRYLCDPRKRRSSECCIWEEILEAFANADDIDFAYPTQRFYNNALEGKPPFKNQGSEISRK